MSPVEEDAPSVECSQARRRLSPGNASWSTKSDAVRMRRAEMPNSLRSCNEAHIYRHVVEHLVVHELLRALVLSFRPVGARGPELLRHPAFIKPCDHLASSHLPCLLPTVLKYPAEKPPVKAPWKRLRPFSSVAT